MPPRRCPNCEFTYAWDGAFCGHCQRPYPRRPAWNACTEPRWFFRHHRTPPFQQLLFFGCACVRRVLRLLPSGAGNVLETLEEAVEKKLRVSTAAHSLVENFAASAGPRGSAGHTALQALHALVDAVWAGRSRPGEMSNAVFAAADAVAVAEGLAEVPETADEQREPPAFVDDPNRGTGPGRISLHLQPPHRPTPRGMTRAEEAEWRAWQAASGRAVQTRQARVDATGQASAALCGIYRDVIAYPFEPVAFDSEWRTSTAVALARQAREARDFGILPYLADALQDAGCEEHEILDHCRGPGNHVRGCWVLEAVLEG